MQTLGAESRLELGVEGRECAAHPADQQVRDRRVAREDGPVEICREQPGRSRTVDRVPIELLGCTVAAAGHDSTERRDVGAERRAPAVVLEAGQAWERHRRRVERRRQRVDDDLSDQPLRSGARDGVDESHPVERRAVGGVVGAADELEAGAHRQHRGAAAPRALDRGA